MQHKRICRFCACSFGEKYFKITDTFFKGSESPIVPNKRRSIRKILGDAASLLWIIFNRKISFPDTHIQKTDAGRQRVQFNMR